MSVVTRCEEDPELMLDTANLFAASLKFFKGDVAAELTEASMVASVHSLKAFIV